MSQIGSAQAGGTLGGANAISGGIGGASNSILQSILLSQLSKQSNSFGGGLAGLQYGNAVNTGLQGDLNGSGYYSPTSGMNIDPTTFLAG